MEMDKIYKMKEIEKYGIQFKNEKDFDDFVNKKIRGSNMYQKNECIEISVTIRESGKKEKYIIPEPRNFEAKAIQKLQYKREIKCTE